MNTDLLDKPELLALARLDFEKERYDRALIHLKQAQSVGGDDIPEVWALLGVTYARLRLWAKAQTALNHFLKLQPDALNERLQLGMTHLETGDNAKALEILQEVLQKQDKHPPALYYSAVANARLGRLQEALQCCGTVVSTSAENNLFHKQANELLQKLRADPRLRQSATGTSAAAQPPKRH